ncbi:MAG: tRNA (N6-isopentenyl adenosine(37)-C2)-methylthiotransferase MiaB [Planctomycetota bacterium]|nr:tRNA (N6-isopentenyl adenosine(37)-C2)-methylthiotransferase MiaB [Planctomycetota bacterium]
MRYYLEVSGCQMNRLDAEILDGVLRRRGWERVRSPKECDVALFFACSVRRHAEEKIYSHIGSLKNIKQRNNLIVGLLGCTAQLEKENLFKRLEILDLVAGPGALRDVPDALIDLQNGAKELLLLGKENTSYDKLRRCDEAPFSAYVRVVSGCSRNCAYCVVPRARGRAIERPPEEVLCEVEALSKNGTKEVILIGQDVSAYSYNGYKLADLLRDALKIEGIVRFGFVTSHPTSVNERLFEVMASDERMSRYLHLPAQSGSDRILSLMRRNYTVKEYLETVNTARRIVPELELASDFIVGFPTETEEEFEASRRLIKECVFLNSFIFKYSERPNTLAALKLKDDVPAKEKQRRNIELLKTQEEASLLRKQRLIGQKVRVLVEGYDKKSKKKMTGRTWNNHIVVFEGEAKRGDVVLVEVERVTPLVAFGTVVC